MNCQLTMISKPDMYSATAIFGADRDFELDSHCHFSCLLREWYFQTWDDPRKLQPVSASFSGRCSVDITKAVDFGEGATPELQMPRGGESDADEASFKAPSLLNRSPDVCQILPVITVWICHLNLPVPSGKLTVCDWTWPSRNSESSHSKWWICPYKSPFSHGFPIIFP